MYKFVYLEVNNSEWTLYYEPDRGFVYKNESFEYTNPTGAASYDLTTNHVLA